MIISGIFFRQIHPFLGLGYDLILKWVLKNLTLTLQFLIIDMRFDLLNLMHRS